MRRCFRSLLPSVLLCLSLASIRSTAAAEAGGTYATSTVLADGDTWTTPLTINGGATVSIPNLATVTYGATTNLTHSGTGTLRIDEGGTFLVDATTSAASMNFSGSLAILNAGTVQLDAGTDILLSGSGATFTNNGLIQKTVASADATFIYGDAGFTAGAGSQILSQAGTLRVATGGISDATAQWNADGGNLDIAGTWSGTIAGSSRNGDIRITNSGNASVASDLTVGSGGLTLDIEGSGLLWEDQAIDTAGNKVTNKGVFHISPTGDRSLTGGGEFVNASSGTMIIQDRFTLADATVIRNQGEMLITSGRGGFNGSGTVVNEATGAVDYASATFDLSGDTEFRNDGTYRWRTGTITVADGAKFENNGVFNIDSTTNHTLRVTAAEGSTFTNTATGTMNWSRAGTLSFAGTGGGTTLTNDGAFNVTGNGNHTFSGTGTFVNNGNFNHLIIGSSDDLVGTGSDGEFINNGDFNIVGSQDVHLANGYRFTNNGTITKTALNNSTDPAEFFALNTDTSAGLFDNQGTLRVHGGVFRVSAAVNGAFRNLPLAQNHGSELDGGTWVADSTVTDVVSFATIDLAVFGATNGIYVIGSEAVVDLIGSGANLTQLNSLTYVLGEFYVSSGKNFDASETSAFTVFSSGTIGGNGTFSDAVTVEGAVTPGADRGTETGKLTFASDVTFNAGSSITLQLKSPTGTAPLDGSVTGLNIGQYIDALADTDPTTEHDAIDANGTLTLNEDMTISILADGAGFTFGQYFDILDWNGNLYGIYNESQLGEILHLSTLADGYQWHTELFLTKGIIYVTPEPSRALLLLGGVMALVMRRRRK